MTLIHPFLWRTASLILARFWVCSLHVSKGQVWYLRCAYCNQLCLILLLLSALQTAYFPASTGEATPGEGLRDRGSKISRVKVQKRQTEKQGGRQRAKGAEQTAPCPGDFCSPGAAVGITSAKEGARQSHPRYKEVNKYWEPSVQWCSSHLLPPCPNYLSIMPLSSLHSWLCTITKATPVLCKKKGDGKGTD